MQKSKILIPIFISIILFLLFSTQINSFVLVTNERDGEIQTAYWQYSKMPIKLTVDSKDISFIGLNGEEITKRCINPWLSTGTSFVNFEISGYTENEITADSITNEDGQYYQSIKIGLDSNYIKDGDDSHEVIFDVDGSIISEVFNVDSDAVIGAGIPFVDGESGLINDGFIILNTSINLSLEILEAAMVHEFGHFLGIGHTNITPNILNDKTLPTMYYTSFPEDDSLGRTLESDDIAAISTLYPAKNFEEFFGAISGTLLDQGGSPIFGISVVAISEDGERAVGVLSGHLTGESGDGEWIISGVPEGKYYLFAIPIDGGKEVSNLRGSNIGGIYTSISTDFNAKFIPNISLNFDYGENNEILKVKISTQATILNVKRGKTIYGITIINNGADIVTASEMDGSFPYIANGENWTKETAPSPASGIIIETEESNGCAISSSENTNSIYPLLFFLVFSIYNLTNAYFACRRK